MPSNSIEEAAVFQCCVAILIGYTFIMKRTRVIRRKRRWWVRPINQRRFQQGDYDNLLREMRLWDPEQFFVYTRMTPERFDKLLNLVGPSLKKSRKGRQPLSEGIRLAVTLRYLATGDDFQSIAFAFRIGKSTCCTIVHETTQAIWNVLAPIYLAEPTEEDYLSSSHGFSDLWQLPNCVGAIDGKHVRIVAPSHSGSQYFNYKNTFSIVLLAICNANYVFTYVDVGAFGSQSDGGILRNSDFGKKLFGESLPLPKPEPLPYMTSPTPYFFAADEAFGLHKNIMRPFPGNGLTDTQRVYNYRLCRGRRTIENAFGILVARWRIYHRVINGKPQNVDRIIKATVCLHNYLKMEDARSANMNYCPQSFIDRELGSEVEDGDWHQEDPGNRGALQPIYTSGRRMSSRNSSLSSNSIRFQIAEYFSSSFGAVGWQMGKINRGLQQLNNS